MMTLDERFQLLEDRVAHLEKELAGRRSTGNAPAAAPQQTLSLSGVLSATCAKLNDGSYGARVKGENTEAGMIAKVVTKAGKSWQVKLISCVQDVMYDQSGDAYTIWTTESLDRKKTEPKTFKEGTGAMRNAVERAAPNPESTPALDAMDDSQDVPF